MADGTEPRVVRRRRSPKGEQRRDDIIAAAAELFAEGGLDSVGLTDIAARAGLTRAGLLHHFPSKNDLLLAVLERRDGGGSAELPASGVDALLGYLEVLRGNEADPSEMQFFAMMSTQSIATSHPAHEHFRERQAQMTAIMSTMLADVFDEARLQGDTELTDIARWLIALAEGLRDQWLRSPDSLDRMESIYRFLESMAPTMHDEARERVEAYLRAQRAQR
ncbi:TetR/AcrR family transcriptional regulator [Demequina sp. NBRC 110056]|uniref:TetR/AcrR family transcriptional regulator n=1 Tax=Demequina sp. NBRC 110056 TaxID=1570345 RepID=UPI0013562D78|nr:TetR/AcrR family transcriptional regulator [Demequina sp. NBRC 110056]